VLGQQIGAGAHDLAHLDEGGPQAAEQLEHRLPEPGLAPVAAGEADQQPDPAQPPADRLLHDQEGDDERSQNEPAALEGLPHGGV
jgi:hypothetical protein